MERKKFEVHPSKEFRIEAKTFRIELPDETPLSQVEPIEEGGHTINSKDDLKRVVELPVLDACEILFDKGIRTVFSSANKKDVGGTGHIALDLESLSPTNREIALRIGEEGTIHGSQPKRGVYITFPISEHSTVAEIRRVTLSLVNQFEDQPSEP